MFAKEWLIRTLSDPNIINPCPVSVITLAAQGAGIKKRELKQARKDVGVVSFSSEGVQYWYLSTEQKDA